jgi:hypothetical protein
MTKTYLMAGFVEKVCGISRTSSSQMIIILDAIPRSGLSVFPTKLDVRNARPLKHRLNRYMGLSDLMKEIKLDPQAFLGDESVELKVLGQVLQLVEDKISEVKNQAVKW